jgi:hypothetical protein
VHINTATNTAFLFPLACFRTFALDCRKHILNSPLLSRRARKNRNTNNESSDDEVACSGDEIVNGRNFKDLESFQKAQLRQKVLFILH